MSSGGDGQLVSLAQQEFPQIFPSPGHVEHDPEAIWSSQIATAREALARAGLSAQQIAAIGVTNQRETTVVWDRETGKPVTNAIVWQSRISARICEELKSDGLEETFRSRTGLVLDPYFSGTKLKFLLDTVAGLKVRAERGDVLFGTVDSFLIWRLTGGMRHVTDVSNASRTLLFNIHTLDWDDTLLEILGVPRAMLPEVRASSEWYGETEASLSWARRFPSPGPPAISRRRSSARPASSRDRQRTPTALAASCYSIPVARRCRRKMAC